MLVDTHAHLHCLSLEKYDNNLSLALKNATVSGISHMLCVCIHPKELPEILSIAEQYPTVSATVGLHPNETIEQEPTIDDYIQWSNHPKIIAIGETGLDYFRSNEKEPWQQNRFRNHIQAARAVKKPIIVHSRMAREDTIDILREQNADEVSGILHCFTETWEMAKQALDLGFYISFSGIITFKNAVELQNVVKKVPLENMLIETDCPYLAPLPYRGKPNEPAYVRFVAEKIAELKNESFEKVAEQTTANFYRLFGL